MHSTLKPHELNQHFEWRDREGPFRVLSNEQAEQYNRDGFVVLENVFDPETISELIEEIDPLEARLEEIVRDQFNGKAFIARAGEITFTPHLVMESPRAKAFTQRSFFRDIAYDLLGEDVRLYWDQAVYKKPGTLERFPWHQDNGYTFIEPQQYLTCWVALTDTDEESGCPLVMKGRHRDGTYAHTMTDLGWEIVEEAPGPVAAAPVRAGGVVVFSSLTPHKTGPNRSSDHVRKTYIVQFAPEGACLRMPEGGEQLSIPCNDPERQYAILVDGETPT